MVGPLKELGLAGVSLVSTSVLGARCGVERPPHMDEVRVVGGVECHVWRVDVGQVPLLGLCHIVRAAGLALALGGADSTGSRLLHFVLGSHLGCHCLPNVGESFFDGAEGVR